MENIDSRASLVHGCKKLVKKGDDIFGILKNSVKMTNVTVEGMGVIIASILHSNVELRRMETVRRTMRAFEIVSEWSRDTGASTKDISAIMDMLRIDLLDVEDCAMVCASGLAVDRRRKEIPAVVKYVPQNCKVGDFEKFNEMGQAILLLSTVI
jgi:hypothetical protein